VKTYLKLGRSFERGLLTNIKIKMKKLLIIFFAFLPFILWGECTSQIRVGYFYPTSHLMRKIYRDGGVEYEAEGSVRLCDRFSFWTNISTFRRDGHSLGLHDRTTVHLYPFSLGLKYTLPITCQLSAYAGIGPSYSWMKIHDRSSFVRRHTRKYAWGGVAKAGLLYYFCDCYFLDLFADYYYTRVHKQGGSVDIGGLRTGAGLGIIY
jgi:hypothetical protein